MLFLLQFALMFAIIGLIILLILLSLVRFNIIPGGKYLYWIVYHITWLINKLFNTEINLDYILLFLVGVLFILVIIQRILNWLSRKIRGF